MEKKILVVGDIHGEWGHLNTLINKKKPDIILQVGDFGWWPIMESLHKTWKLTGVKTQNTQVYWCDGNHEEYPHLKDLDDGQIHEMYENVYYCSRGSTLELPDGRIILFVGGASSHDKEYRTPGYDWFPEENIARQQIERVLNIDKKIDIVISHDAPQDFKLGLLNEKADANRLALSLILDKFKPKQWFFGHHHMYRTGKYNNTEWTCLSYPGEGSRWWISI